MAWIFSGAVGVDQRMYDWKDLRENVQRYREQELREQWRRESNCPARNCDKCYWRGSCGGSL